MHYVYILRSVTGRIYVGYSNDLRERLKSHKWGKVKTTESYEKVSLIWYCGFLNKKKALDFERYLKEGSGHTFAKRHLISS